MTSKQKRLLKALNLLEEYINDAESDQESGEDDGLYDEDDEQQEVWTKERELIEQIKLDYDLND